MGTQLDDKLGPFHESQENIIDIFKGRTDKFKSKKSTHSEEDLPTKMNFSCPTSGRTQIYRMQRKESVLILKTQVEVPSGYCWVLALCRQSLFASS